MKRLKKRLEALSEIFESEKSYIYDLKIWGEDFRKYLFKSETLTIEKKHALTKTLFVNLDAIISLHELIASELGKRNEYFREINGLETGDIYRPLVVNDDTSEIFKDMEYHSAYYKYLNRFGIYRYYVSRLPTVEFDLDKECNMNKFFKNELLDFFRQRGIELGPKHFIFRASQKLARYTILWNAVLHYEDNPVFIEGINQTVSRLKEIAKNVDATYGSINESYKLFRFSTDLHYSDTVKNKVPLKLFQKQRKILREGDIIMKYKNIKEPKLLRFILLDTVILICDVVKQGSIEIKYIITEPLPLFKYLVTERNIGYTFDRTQLENMEPLFLLERAGTDIVVMFFRDRRVMRMYQDDINLAIDNARKSIRTDVMLYPLLENTNLEILCCSTRDLSFDERRRHVEESTSSLGTVNIGDMSVDEYDDEVDENSLMMKALSVRRKSANNQQTDKTDGEERAECEKQDEDPSTMNNAAVVSARREDGNNQQTDGEERAECEKQDEDLQKMDNTAESTVSGSSMSGNEGDVNMISENEGHAERYKKKKKHRYAQDNTQTQQGQLRFATQVDSYSSSEPSENENVEQRVSFINRILGRGKKDNGFSNSFRVERGDYSSTIRKDEQFLLFGTNEGLFKKCGSEFVNIYNKCVNKIVYDVINKIIIFLEKDKILCAPFVPLQDSLHTKVITRGVSNFFYGSTLKKLTIASLTVSNNYTTSISLFKVILNNDSVSVAIDRKLFVGCLVNYISFFDTKLVIACRDFEMVDSDTLKTQELVDPLDLCIPFFFKEMKHMSALRVFTIERDVFLVCYDHMGFFIDSYGRTMRQNIVFVWYIKPKQFKLFKNYLAGISTQEIVLWDLKTAEVVFHLKKKNLSFVVGSSSLLLHDENSLYKLTIG